MILERPGHPPTIREMTTALNFHSPHAVAGHLNAMRKIGLVDWQDCQGRTLVARCKFIHVDDLEKEPRMILYRCDHCGKEEPMVMPARTTVFDDPFPTGWRRNSNMDPNTPTFTHYCSKDCDDKANPKGISG
jgi:hypothetical protein